MPDWSFSRHSKVISKLYVSLNLAGLFRILTPSRDTTDIFAVVVGQDWLFEKRWGVSCIFAAYCSRDQCRESSCMLWSW